MIATALGLLAMWNSADGDAARLIRCIETRDRACLAAALKAPPKPGASAEYLSAAAEANLLVGRNPEAIASIQAALKAKPGDYDLLMQQGRIYQRCGQQVDAIESFLTAAKVKPPTSTVFYSLGMSFFLLHEYERAGKHFQHAAELDPNDDRAEFMLAAIDVLQNSNEAAARVHLEKALALKPDNVHYLIHYGALLARLDENEKAVTVLEKAVKADPASALAHYNLGRVYRQMDQMAQAKPQLEAAVRLRPELGRAYYHLASVYRALGEIAKMNDALQKFSKLKDQDKTEELVDGPPSYSIAESPAK